MTAPPAERLTTAGELAELPDDGHLYELLEGRLVCMSPSASLPGVVAGNVFGELWTFVRSHPLGVLGTADSGFLLTSDPDTVRAPDAWFVRAERVPSTGIPQAFWPGAPDLAVEVISPTDRYHDVIRKALEYLAAGAWLVWAIDPAGRTAAIFHPDRTAMLIGEDDTLDGEDLLPGFRIRLGDLFPRQ